MITNCKVCNIVATSGVLSILMRPLTRLFFKPAQQPWSLFMYMAAQKLNKTESTIRKRRGKVEAAHTNQPFLAKSVQRHIYFLAVSQINNFLSVLLYKMISLKQRETDGVR